MQPSAEVSFPRTRGDGPCSEPHPKMSRRFPPHTRGWTLQHQNRPIPVGVSPAHAGMDPARSHIRRCPGGFPAHAGMDPSTSEQADTSRSFPRTRGDGPGDSPKFTLESLFPPHTRGWTLQHQNRPIPVGVSPAHAGMDRETARSSRWSPCFPRTRGEGTRSLLCHSGAHRVSPAHAGMDRSGESMTSTGNSFPPHTRGWTVLQSIHSGAGRVSPAHAGMDRDSENDRQGDHGFPRTRGDGPLGDVLLGRK